MKLNIVVRWNSASVDIPAAEYSRMSNDQVIAVFDNLRLKLVMSKYPDRRYRAMALRMARFLEITDHCVAPDGGDTCGPFVRLAVKMVSPQMIDFDDGGDWFPNVVGVVMVLALVGLAFLVQWICTPW